MAVLEIRNLTYFYPGQQNPAIRNLSFTLQPGEFVLLCGQSGSGKTTLLRHMKTALAPFGKRTGEILLDGTDLSRVPPKEQAEKVGFVMQNPDEQIVTDKVWHELAFGLENLGIDRGTQRLRVAEMASFFGIQDWFHRETCELSGGQKQLLNLASVMAMQPEILVLDEPTSQLDPIAAADFLNTLKKINRELGTTILMTEHRVEDIFPYADRVAVLESGTLTVCAPPREAARQLRAENSPLFAALPAPVRSYYAAGGAAQPPLTVREGRQWLTENLPANPDFREVSRESPVFSKESAVSVKDLWFRYEKDSPDILRGVTMEIPKGCFFAIVGGNGTGKSTTLKSLCGICKPYRGNIQIFSKPLRSYRKELFRENLAMLPQDPHCLFVKNSVLEDLEEMSDDQAQIQHVAALCRLEGLLKRNPADLSGGEIQRAALAKVLLTKPRLLLLDEPTKGLDSGYKQELARLFAQLTGSGVTLLAVSHDIEFCAAYADLVGLFFDGQLLTYNTPKKFFGANSFYTTAANRMSRCLFRNAVTAEDVAALYRQNQEVHT